MSHDLGENSHNVMAKTARISESAVPNYVDLNAARASSVAKCQGLLNEADRELVMQVQREVIARETLVENNPQNLDHQNKQCTFLNKGEDLMRQRAPRVLAKMLRFAQQAWEEQQWGSDQGPLHAIPKVPQLSIRVVEHWEYSTGGKLDDPNHFDAGSIVTVVCLLNDCFEGGVFQTYESDGKMLQHSMSIGDSICFVSHKLHNVAEVVSGTRKSLVMEMWEGGLPLWCR